MWKMIFQSNFGEEIHYETKKIYRVVMSPYLLECFSQRIPDFFRPFLKILIQTLHIKKAEPFSAIKEFKFTLRFPGGCMQNVRLRHALEVNGFPTWCFGKESTCNAVDLGSTPGSGRSPWTRGWYPFLYSCLENSMGRGAWRAIVRHDWVANTVTFTCHLS